MKTRNLKTDMTEFQWWWSHFPKYKKIVTWQSGNFFSSELKRKYFLNMKTFIKASDALSISSTAVTLLSTSNINSGAILNRNWNLFHSDWRGLRHHQCRVTRKCKNKKAKLLLTKPSINYIFLVNETTLLCEGKRQWIAIKRDIEWMWKNIEICGLLFAFNGLFFLNSIQFIAMHHHPFVAVFNVSPIKTLIIISCNVDVITSCVRFLLSKASIFRRKSIAIASKSFVKFKV